MVVARPSRDPRAVHPADADSPEPDPLPAGSVRLGF